MPIQYNMVLVFSTYGCHEFQLPLAPEVFKKGGQYLLRLGSEDVPGLSDAKNNLRMSGMNRTKWWPPIIAVV